MKKGKLISRIAWVTCILFILSANLIACENNNDNNNNANGGKITYRIITLTTDNANNYIGMRVVNTQKTLAGSGSYVYHMSYTLETYSMRSDIIFVNVTAKIGNSYSARTVSLSSTGFSSAEKTDMFVFSYYSPSNRILEITGTIKIPQE